MIIQYSNSTINLLYEYCIFLERMRIKMKFLDIYFNYKLKNKDYIIIYPVGTFYNVLGDDTLIISNLLGYQIKTHCDIPKVGFPVNSLEKVLYKLETNKINYILLEKKNGIIQVNLRKRFKYKKYDEYFENTKINKKIQDRIKKISNFIYNNYDNIEIKKIIEIIESMYER